MKIFLPSMMLLPVLVLSSCASETSRSAASSSGSTQSGARQEVRTPSDAGTTAGTRQHDFKRYEADYREHYNQHYAHSGYAYNQLRPAYEYGFELAIDPRYRDMEWNRLEPPARRGWDDSTMGLWDQYRDAVQYGWERARSGRG